MARTLKDYPSVTLRTEDLDGKIDFRRVFGRAGPIHIEIGCGKATFVLKQAMTQPEVNFLGIEWARKYYRFAVDRIGRWGLNNVRIIRADAAGFLADFVPDDSVDDFHIYFPDPWPKRRHHKRRFFCQNNLELLFRCLKTGGTLKTTTDHAEYFEVISGLIEVNKDKFQPRVFLPGAGAKDNEWVGTNFERKYLKEQRLIFRLAVVKL